MVGLSELWVVDVAGVICVDSGGVVGEELERFESGFLDAVEILDGLQVSVQIAELPDLLAEVPPGPERSHRLNIKLPIPEHPQNRLLVKQLLIPDIALPQKLHSLLPIPKPAPLASHLSLLRPALPHLQLQGLMALSDDLSVAACVCRVQSVGACPWEVEIAADFCCSVGLQLEAGQL